MKKKKRADRRHQIALKTERIRVLTPTELATAVGGAATGTCAPLTTTACLPWTTFL